MSKNLVEVNRGRAQLVAELCASRIAQPNLWRGYTRDEELCGELRRQSQIHFWRKDSPQAVLVLENPTMHDIKEVDWGDEVITESNVVERYKDSIHIGKDVEYDEEVSHTFSKTRSLLEQAKIGAEAAIRGLVGGEYAGAKAEVEVSAKISAEYSKQWGEQDQITDTITRDVKVHGPIDLEYEAVRSIDRAQRKITAKTDFEYAIGLIDETGAGQNPPRIYYWWESFLEFISIIEGTAPRTKDWTRGDGVVMTMDVPMYNEFRDDPLSGQQIHQLKKVPTGKTVFIVEYDNVIGQKINII